MNIQNLEFKLLMDKNVMVDVKEDQKEDGGIRICFRWKYKSFQCRSTIEEVEGGYESYFSIRVADDHLFTDIISMSARILKDRKFSLTPRSSYDQLHRDFHERNYHNILSQSFFQANSIIDEKDDE